MRSSCVLLLILLCFVSCRSVKEITENRRDLPNITEGKLFKNIISNELDLDGVYDLAELGSKAGILSINIQAKSADEVTIENLAEILLSIRETLDQANLPFYTIACRFYYSDQNDIRVSGLLYEDIYEEDFETRIYDALII